MAAGAVMSVARISVALAGPGAIVDPRDRRCAPVADPVARPGEPVADPALGDPVAPRAGQRFTRATGGPAVAEPVDPVAPGTTPPTEPTRRI